MKTKVETHKIMDTAKVSKVETKRKTTPNLQGCGQNENEAHKNQGNNNDNNNKKRICPTSKGEANEAGFSSGIYFLCIHQNTPSPL